MMSGVKVVHGNSGEITSLTKQSFIEGYVRSFACPQQNHVWIRPENVSIFKTFFFEGIRTCL